MNYLPFFALAALPKERRSKVLPIALPAIAGLPVAQAGALAVVTADSVARRERDTARTDATEAVRSTITRAVESGATLTRDDFQGIPIAREIIDADPGILQPVPTRLRPDELKQITDAVAKALAKQTEEAPRASSRTAARPDGGSKRAAAAAAAPTSNG